MNAMDSQWTNKAYDFTTSTPIPFPSQLAQTCQSLIRGIPWHRVFGDVASRFTTIRPPHWKDWAEDYRPDTGIVNFYGMKDTLMGHVDRSE
jgi:alkylated DNA repair protein alkB family protein 1